MRGAEVVNDKTVVGLDVHATMTIAAALRLATGELCLRRLNGPPREAVSYLQGLPGPVIATYEAGPMGYGLARAAADRGLDVRVCADQPDPSGTRGRGTNHLARLVDMRPHAE
jgi:transposase